MNDDGNVRNIFLVVLRMVFEINQNITRVSVFVIKCRDMMFVGKRSCYSIRFFLIYSLGVYSVNFLNTEEK